MNTRNEKRILRRSLKRRGITPPKTATVDEMITLVVKDGYKKMLEPNFKWPEFKK